MAELYGQPFMPWQRYVADVGCELDPQTGLPAYREIIVTVPRQSGKTTLFVTWQVDRCLNWGRTQRSVFTAQTGKDARDKWLDEIIPQLEQSKLKAAIRSVNRANGNEGIRFKTGSLIRLLSTSASSGHSKTLDQAVLDEIWHDVDDRREQGLRPAMATRPDAQLLICSTAGTQDSTVLNHKIRTGRASAAADTGSDIAYFEWSAPDDWDADDEESYFGFMPALCPDPPCRCGGGAWRHTTSLKILRTERAAMKPMEFARAYGNRSTVASERVIGAESWNRVCDPAFKPEGRMRFAVDVAEDRSWSSIVVAGANRTIELLAHEEGTSWLIPKANALIAKFGGAVIRDASGPAGALNGFTKVHDMRAGDVVKACGAMYDAITEQTVRFRTHPSLDAAAAGAVKRQSGDTWAWSRKASKNDITPLMAATLALAAPHDENNAVFF